jgi:hypothetical protein
MIDSTIIGNLESLGDRYCSRYLEIWRSDIAENWWTAFRFFFNHAFMRGRRDQLSEEYFRYAIVALKEYFCIPDNPVEKDFLKLVRHHSDFIKDFAAIMTFKISSERKRTANSIRDGAFNTEITATHPLVNKLVAKSNIHGQRSLNNDRDLLMVLSSLSFLTHQGMPANIHNYIVNQLTAGNTKGVVKAIKEVYAVGDKLSAFILRDIILMNPNIKAEDQSLAFPIDTWVVKVANRLGCTSEDHAEIRKFFIDRLEGTSAAKVAAGLWYLGFNSLDILLVNLDKVDMTSWRERE